MIKLTALAALLLAATSAPAQTSITYLETSKAWSSVVADFDRDGHDDLFVEGHDGGEDRIWFWTPAGYLPSPFTFPSADRHACVAADVNLDGLLDMYCAIGAERRTGLKANELWIQQPGGKWIAAQGFGAESPSDSSRYPLFLDIDHDGYPDLYSSSEDVPRSDGLPDYNHVYLNDRNTTFTEIQTIATGEKGWKCVSKGDVDGDGWDDLLVCSQVGNAQIYVNDHANDFVLLASPAIGQWRDAKLVDMDGDGRDDLVVVDWNDDFLVYLNTGASPYFVTPAFQAKLPKGDAQNIAIGDFNHDGLRDVYVTMETATCESAAVLQDAAPDVVFWGAPGNTWTQEVLAQSFAGCGHRADVIDGDKVLLENGGVGYRGPNFVLGWQK
jgi:hypothetical protein